MCRTARTARSGARTSCDAEILLLGVGHDANTTVHLAENLAGVRYKLPKYATVMRDGQPVRHHYDEIDHCCANFALLDSWLEARGHQQRGFVAGAPARLIGARDVVATALDHLRENETVFLHPRRCVHGVRRSARRLPLH